MNKLLKPQKIFFLLDQFPEGINSSLILEIEELKKRKIPVRIFCLHKNRKKSKEFNFNELKDVIQIPDLKAKILNIITTIFLLFRKSYGISCGLLVLIKDNLMHPAFLVRLLSKLPRIVWITNKILKRPQAIIHVQGSSFCTQVGWFISRLTRKPYLAEIEADVFIKKNGNLVRVISDTKGLLTRTKSSKQALMDHYGKLEIPIWPHYQSVKLFENVNGESPKDNPFSLLVFCRDEPIEGITTLLNALSILEEQKVLFHCNFIGCGQTYDRVESLVLDRNLEHMVSVFVEITGDEYFNYMQDAHALIIPYGLRKSPYCGCVPDWVLQAMAMRLPIIAFNEGVIQEVLKDFVSGILVNSEDSFSMASAIQTLYYHPDIRKQFGIRAKQIIDTRYNLVTNINILEEIYNTVAE